VLEINFHPFPVIETERLILRRIEESDIHEVFFLRSDKTVLKYIDKPAAKSLDEARDFISRINALEKNNTGVNWAISIRGYKKLIGNICLWNINAQHHRGEVGYVLHPEHHGKGIMQESIEDVLDYGFRILKLHSIEAHVNPFNKASIKLLERNNFQKEAYFKENWFFENKFLDTAIYSLLTPVKENRK